MGVRRGFTNGGTESTKTTRRRESRLRSRCSRRAARVEARGPVGNRDAPSQIALAISRRPSHFDPACAARAPGMQPCSP